MLSKAFKFIENDERRPLILLFIHSFLNGIALVLFETTANTLFLIQYDTSSLPYVYILTAFVSVISGYFYSKLEDSLSIVKLLRVIMLFVIGIILFFLVLIKFSDSKLAYMGIMVSKDLVWMFVGMEFGIITGMIFNIRQGKRLFGLLMSGEISAGIIGGLSIGVILSYINTVDLLYISIFTLLVSFFLLNYILKRYADSFIEETQEDEDEIKVSYSSMFKNKYYISFFVISILAFLIFYFIDYLFYYHVEAKLTNEKELASFFGVFYALLNIVNLVSSLFISGRMLSRYGVLFGIMAIPLLAIIGTSSLVIGLMLSVGIGFIIIVALKLFNEVLDISILGPTFKILYQSIPLKLRMKVLAFRETIIEPLAMGLAGVLLLGISLLEGVEIVYYSIVFASVIWIALGKMLKDQYILSLEKLLHQREVFENDLFLEDVDINIFLDGVQSTNDIQVIYCLDTLVKLTYKDIDSVFEKLLTHNSSRIRNHVLNYIDKFEKDSFIGVLSTRVESEKNAEVLNTLLKIYCKFRAVDAIERLSFYIDDKEPKIQEGAIVGLLQFGGIDGILIAGKVLNRLFESENKEQQLIALHILAEMDTPSFYVHLNKSLSSDDVEIKSMAIKVVGNLKVKRLLPELLKYLEFGVYRNIVIQSLMKFEDKILDTLVVHFHTTESLNTKHALIKVVSVMHTKESEEFLLEHIKNPLLCDFIFQRLFDTKYRSQDDSCIESLILEEISKIIYYLNALNILDKESFSNTSLVIEELIAKKINNIFLILGAMYSKEMLLQSMINYNKGSKNTKAYTVEIIDNMLASSTKQIVLPILEDVSIDKKMANYEGVFSYENISTKEQLIDDILSNEGLAVILKISLLYELVKNLQMIYIEQIKKLVHNTNTDIKETSIWALSQLEKGRNAINN